jgi:iron complex outermembrane recepter protein
MTRHFISLLMGGACAALMAQAAFAGNFNIPSGDLKSALDGYAAQTGVALIYPAREVAGVRSHGASGELAADTALSRILSGTGFTMRRHQSGAIAIVRDDKRSENATDFEMSATPATSIRLAAAAASAGIESVVVTSSKIKGDIQTVPIAITALSQEQLTSRQIAGGPDLVKEVPNLTFSKTNFTGYNIQIRGIGTQAISVTTDPAVAVALNDTPFIRNHFFEQEFYDVNQVEVLRGPQGTLYGRNATAGVVNVISAKPTDQFEAMASADWGNYHNRRYEGMINVPIVDDRLDMRVAAEWTKRDGYSFNGVTNSPIDGRDLWSSRITFGLKPVEGLQIYAVWEHFQENDDRMRTAKQLCHRQPILALFGGDAAGTNPFGASTAVFNPANYGSQGCQMSSLYSPDAFQVPNGFSLPYYFGAAAIGAPVTFNDPYLSQTQSRNLRVIETAFNPIYRAKNDVVELNADYALTPALTLTSQTGYNRDFLWSLEDFNRFTTAPGAFAATTDGRSNANGGSACNQYGCVPTGTVCDPQVGCSDRLTAEDLSDENAWQLSQEFRLASSFNGPLNFSAGGNYLHYETLENYYVFINSLTAAAASIGSAGCGYHYGCTPYVNGVSDNSACLYQGYVFPDPALPHGPGACAYIDPNPVTKLDGNGHNYFRSENPYVLNSYAAFGEGYFNISPDLKLTGGLRWTNDRKHFIDIPSELLVDGWGYPSVGTVDQQWNELTGRAAVNWTPKLDFTDQTLVYGSYSHGYKAGGANPPGAILLTYGGGSVPSEVSEPVHPLTFKPEFVNAFELGTKNTMFDGALTLNMDGFYYNYKSYQISEIVDRTSINLNFDAHVKGAEVEATWEPLPGLRFNFAGGYEDARLAKGSKAVDLIDRTAGNPNWLVLKPFVTQASNCILPVYVLQYQLQYNSFAISDDCGVAYDSHVDPVTGTQYVENPLCCNRHGDPIVPGSYVGFDPVSVDPHAPADVNGGLGLPPNNGAGFDKDLSNNMLPNAPHFTTSLSAEYTMPVSEDWAASLHSDFYWQSQSYARVFNDRPYDKIRGYSNVNLALILTSASGWQVMGYLKNVFDTTAITGDFLNSDDTGLTTNVFLTDPRLYGVRVTKNF